MAYALFSPLAAEASLFIIALFLLVYGAYFSSAKTAIMVNALALLGLVFAALVVVSGGFGYVENIMPDMFGKGPFISFAKILILSGSFLALLLSGQWNCYDLDNGNKEYPVLILLICTGLMLLVSSNNFLAFYVGLELASLGMYVLAAYERDNLHSSEAGIKYFVLGALASGMMLYGISLIYGFSGTIIFSDLSTFFAFYPDNVPYGVITGLVFVLVAICFKISAVPFHMWTPDVYQGAPTAVVAFFAAVPKVALLCFAIRLLYVAFGDVAYYWQQVLVVASVGSMVVGAFAGIVQTSIKRLIAYSSIGHMGYILMGILAMTSDAIMGVLFYIVIYVFTSFGIFACLMLLRRDGVPVTSIKELSGVSSSHPRIALALSLLMFSMAGVPPLAGFFAKFFLFAAALKAGYATLVIVAMITSVIACYYYIRIIKVMYFDEAQHAQHSVRKGSPALYVLLIALAINIVMIKPALIMDHAQAAAVELLP